MHVGEKQAYRFGPFELDTQCGQLRRDGVGLKLQGQPVQVLEILLEKHGQLVTREELRERLWASDTFVDFDHSLNTAIKKLRLALGDEADTPRYIETLPRRGYRFVGEVQKEGGPDTNSANAPQAVEEIVSPGAATLAGAATNATSDSRPRRKWILVGVAVIVVVAAVVGVRQSWPLPPPRVVGSKQITNDGLFKYWPVTDGNRVYITEFLAGSNFIAQVSSAGGETTKINVPLSSPPFLSDVSSDGSELLLGTGGFYDGPWWSMPLPAGTPRPLENVIGHHAVWTRDGRLFFAAYDDLYTADHDGANPRKIATAPGRPIRLALSPDGRRLRFSVLKPASNTYEIWEARVDGSDMHPLLPGWNNPPMECCGRWTPDGKYYIFQSARNGASNIWIMPDHSNWWRKSTPEPVQLTTGPLEFRNPFPSRDGRRVFVVASQNRAELVRYDTQSGEFVPYLGGISAGDADFSRDGQWVTYVSYPDRTLWRSRVDGSERLELTYPPMETLLPHWSPDGQQIAFMGRAPGKPWKIFLVPRDGGRAQGITSDQLAEGDPAWSSDGKTLAFSRSTHPEDESSRIGLLNLETRQISHLRGSEQICCPRWSPDGRYIIALTAPVQRLVLYDVRNDKWKHFDTKQAFQGSYLVWSHDSAYVHCDCIIGGETRYCRLRIRDGKLEPLFDFKKLPRRFQVMADSWLGLGPGDTPLFVRDTSTQEIYALDVDFP